MQSDTNFSLLKYIISCGAVGGHYPSAQERDLKGFILDQQSPSQSLQKDKK